MASLSSSRSILVVGITILLLALHQPTGLRAQEEIDTPNLDGLPSGLNADPLAGTTVDAFRNPGPDARIGAQLERIPIDPGEHIDGRDKALADLQYGPGSAYYATGHHLLYIESGTVSFATVYDEQDLYQGDQAFVPGTPGETDAYTIENDSDECASILRLSVFLLSGDMGIGSSAPDRIPNLPVDCGQPSRLLTFGGSVSEASPPQLLFIAELSWEHRSPGYHSHPGHVGLYVESGAVALDVDTSCCLRSFDHIVQTRLMEGSWAAVPPGTPYGLSSIETPSISSHDTSVLMAGAVSPEQRLFLPYEQPLAGSFLPRSPLAPPVSSLGRSASLMYGARTRSLGVRPAPIDRRFSGTYTDGRSKGHNNDLARRLSRRFGTLRHTPAWPGMSPCPAR